MIFVYNLLDDDNMKLKHILFAVAILALSSCTENERSKPSGETQTVNLPAKTKLVNVTWKGHASMWILTRPMRENETPETFTFSEKYKSGIMECTVKFVESK